MSSSNDLARVCITADNVQKFYGTVTALDGASLALPYGKVTALVGDNGAGKSTLVKVLSGVVQHDGGTLTLDSKEVFFHTPNHARQLGVHTLFQDLALADNLDVVENLFLGTEIAVRVAGVRLPWLARRRMEDAAHTLLETLGITTIGSVAQRIEQLSGGQRQVVAIARAVKDKAALVILDEPTAALGVVQSEQVMQNILRVRDGGAAVLIVSHNLREVFAVSDRIAVMRLGRVVETFHSADTDEEEVVAAIVGKREGRSNGRSTS